MGLYHSLKEWDNPLFLNDINNGTKNFIKQILHPSLYVFFFIFYSK